MDNQEPEIESPLREALRRGREVRPAGFTERAVAAVRRDVARRRVIRWSSVAAPLAGCAAALALALGSPFGNQPASEHELAQLVSLHEQLVLSAPRLDDADALTALVVAEFEEASLRPRLEGGEEDLARLVLGS